MNTKKLGIRQKEMYYFCLRNYHSKHEINNNVLNVAISLVERNLLTLTYEELTQGDKDVKNLSSEISDKICKFLNVNVENMYSTTMKVNNSSYEKYISNWDDLKSLKEMLVYE